MPQVVVVSDLASAMAFLADRERNSPLAVAVDEAAESPRVLAGKSSSLGRWLLSGRAVWSGGEAG